MDAIAEVFRIDGERVADTVLESCGKLDSARGEVILDLSAVHRVDSRGLRALQDLADRAYQKSVKVVLRGVNVDIYKVLKLAKLASRFSL